MHSLLTRIANKLKGIIMDDNKTLEPTEVHQSPINRFSVALRERARTHTSNSTREILNEIADVVDEVNAAE